MKNLFYRNRAEQKFRGIFKNAEIAESKFTIETDELEETANSILSRWGLDTQDVKNSWTLLFGDLDDMLAVLNGEVSESDNSEETNDENDGNSKENENIAKDIEKIKKNKLSHEQAINIFKKAGINLYASGGNDHITSDRKLESGTSFANIRKLTVEGIIAFKKHINGEFTLTGGTETWIHARLGGHHQGKKVDVRKTREIADFIQKNTTKNKDIDPMTAPNYTKYKFEKDGYKYIIKSENNPHHFDIKIKKV